jgi:hypothetical protein
VTARRVAAIVTAAGALVLTVASPASAHGVGGRHDLPVPLWQFLYAAAFALIISFLLLRVSWHHPRLAAAAIGRALTPFVERIVAALALVLRALGLVLFFVTLTAAWFGDTNSRNNIAPVMVYVLLWVGLQVLSVLLGNVWSALSPYDTLAAITSWVRTRTRPVRVVEHPADESFVWSHWPAALGVFGFVWLELCYHSQAEPRVIARVITGYSIVVLALAARYGRRWLRTGEAFATLFGLLALMAPFHRDTEGRLRARLPFVGLSEFVPRRGSILLVSVMLGGTGFDGVQRTVWWSNVQGDTTGWDRTWLSTFGLVWVIGIVAVAYIAAAMMVGRIAGTGSRDAPRTFVHSLVPIVFGYSIAHYFTLLIIEGQSAIPLFSNPYGENWNLFGTVNYVINIQPLSARAVSWVQIVAIVTGHVVGVVASHDRAVESYSPQMATRSQTPMLVVMIAFTLCGLTLLLKG